MPSPRPNEGLLALLATKHYTTLTLSLLPNPFIIIFIFIIFNLYP